MFFSFYVLLTFLVTLVPNALFMDAIKLNEQHPHLIKSTQEVSIVRIGILINAISDINFRHSTFKASLSLTVVLEKSKRPTGTTIVPFDQYQYPFSDVLILSKSIKPLDNHRLIITTNDGTSTSQTRYNAEIYCPFQLKNYPLDNHKCEIIVLSARHPVKQLMLSSIHSNEPSLSENVSPPNLLITSLPSEQCELDSTYALTEFNAAHAQFGCIRFKLLMARPIYIPLVHFFLPSTIAVLISWVVVYVDRTRTQTRLTILIFAIFIICFIIFTVYNEIPRLVYITAGDVWLIICLTFLSLSFIEFVVANVLMNLSHKYLRLANKDVSIRAESRYRHEKRALRDACTTSSQAPLANGRVFEKKHIEVNAPSSSSVSNSEVIIHEYFRRWSDYFSVMAARLDLGARTILPILFSLVTFLYVLFYIFL